MWLLPLLYIEARLETSDGESREKAPVERFQRRRDSGASSLVLGTKKNDWSIELTPIHWSSS